MKTYIDDDGYTCFDQVFNDLPGPGVFWTLHHAGWEAFPNESSANEPIVYGKITAPTERLLQEAREAYVEWLLEGKPQCVSCEMKFDDWLLAPLITSEGTINGICPVCALRTINEQHGLAPDTPFYGETASIMHAEAILWVAANKAVTSSNEEEE